MVLSSEMRAQGHAAGGQSTGQPANGLQGVLRLLLWLFDPSGRREWPNVFCGAAQSLIALL